VILPTTVTPAARTRPVLSQLARFLGDHQAVKIDEGSAESDFHAWRVEEGLAS